MILISTLIAASLQAQLSAAVPAQSQPKMPPDNKVIATVDGVELRAADVAPLVWDIYHDGIENDFIDYLTVANAAKMRHLTVTNDEVQASVNQFMDNFKHGLAPSISVEEGLRQRSFSDARVYLRARTELLLNKIQLLSFHPADWVKVSTLVFPTPGTSQQIIKDSAAKAMDSYQRLQKGAPWDTVLREVTSDGRVIQSHGSIGWHPRDAFPPLVRAALEKAKPGEFTNPAQTNNGIQIFRLDAQGANASGVDQAELKNTFLESTRADTIKQIKAKAKVVKY